MGQGECGNGKAEPLQQEAPAVSDAKEVIVSGLGEKVEIWNQEAHHKQVIQDADSLDFGDLAEDVRKDLDGTPEE